METESLWPLLEHGEEERRFGIHTKGELDKQKLRKLGLKQLPSMKQINDGDRTEEQVRWCLEGSLCKAHQETEEKHYEFLAMFQDLSDGRLPGQGAGRGPESGTSSGSRARVARGVCAFG